MHIRQRGLGHTPYVIGVLCVLSVYTVESLLLAMREKKRERERERERDVRETRIFVL